MKSCNYYIAIFIGIFGVLQVFAANLHWKNSGTDMLSAASYKENTVPTAEDVIYFEKPMETQPYLSNDLTVKGLFFGLDNGTRTSATTDPDGYIFTGAEGKKLTLANNGKGNYTINSSTTAGTVIFKVPIVLSAATRAQIGSSGTLMVFEGPIATTGSYTQDFAFGASNNGRLVLANENPDFKPSQVRMSYNTYVELRNPYALRHITKMCSAGWGGTPHFINNTGETVFLDNLSRWVHDDDQGYGGLDGFYFEGDKIVMTNCEFGVSQRDNKARTFNAHVILKGPYAADETGKYFTKDGTNVLEITGGFVEASGIIGNFRHQRGLVYAHTLNGSLFRSGRIFEMTGNQEDLSATLGIKEGTVTLKIADSNGICFRTDDGIRAGFSSMTGTTRLRLVDGNNVLINPIKTRTALPGCTKPMAPRYLAFGHFYAQGTLVLENNFEDVSGDMFVYAFKGGAKVAARFAGNITVKTDKTFEKRGNGVLAIDGGFSMGDQRNATVRAGGLLVNAVNDKAKWYVENGAWLGGKGTVTSAEVKSGALLRAGEDGMGQLTILGTIMNTTVKSGAGIFVEIARNGGAAPLVFQGDKGCVTEATGTKLYVDGDVDKFAPGKNRVKIMDWSAKTGGTDLSMFNIDKYDVTIVDTHKFKSAWLEKDEVEKAVYLVYVRPTAGFSMVFRP